MPAKAGIGPPARTRQGAAAANTRICRGRKDFPARPDGGLHAAGLRDPHSARDRARRQDRVAGDRGRGRPGRAHRRARARGARRACRAARRGQHGRRGGPVLARHLLRQAIARDLRPLRRGRTHPRQGRDVERGRRVCRAGAPVPIQPAARAGPEVPRIRQPAAVLRRTVSGRAHHADAGDRPALEEQGDRRAPRRAPPPPREAGEIGDYARVVEAIDAAAASDRMRVPSGRGKFK
jgi:hypothetical protein